MEVEFTPRPQPEEREALVVGLGRLLARPEPAVPGQYRSEWRRAGLLEATGAEAANVPPPPRRANRA